MSLVISVRDTVSSMSCLCVLWNFSKTLTSKKVVKSITRLLYYGSKIISREE